MARQRQEIHFTPKSGWTNDPNGLIFVNGIYHLFFQHYPDDTHWGPMHWGHATSCDLLHWEEQPIALYPTEEEYIFSGSAILDRDNVSGLGSVEMPPVLLFYTAHNPKTEEQMQCLAYTTDFVTFTKYEGNPVIANRLGESGYKKDFRDPKVFRNEVTGGYGMVLAAGAAIDFYASKDLLHWTYASSFDPGETGLGGLCECPDFFSLEADGEQKYILSMSMIYTEEGATEESHVMQYFVGSFDGGRFTLTQKYSDNQRLDFGADNYAMVTFAECERRLALGWGEDWNAARKNTEVGYFGKMTLARELSLIKGTGGYRIRQTPVCEIKKESEELWMRKLTLGERECVIFTQTGDFAVTEVMVEDEGAEECDEESGPDGILTVRNRGNRLQIDDCLIKRESALKGTDCELTVIYDHGYVEAFAEQGTVAYSRNTGE